jgi:ADP-ribose pyrophosphatase YjhB (NUDIX family)
MSIIVQNNWNAFTDPRPYVTVSVVAIDGEGRLALLHRSDKVRSARNCWSLPSGLHEVGRTMQAQFAEELREELKLFPYENSCAMIGDYENIKPDGDEHPAWHWVIKVMVMRVRSIDELVNSEPDKHDKIDVVHYESDWIHGRVWAPRLEAFLDAHRVLIRERCHQLSHANVSWELNS